MQIFRKIVRASFEIVSDSGHLPGVYFHQVGAGPYPRLRAKSPSKRRGHLAMERFRALLVKGLNLTAQPLLMEYEKEILRLAIFCKLFWD